MQAVHILVWAVVLRIPLYLFNVSVPLPALPPAPTAYSAMQAAARHDPQSLVWDERSIAGHPFVISFGPLACTRELCWYLTLNNASTALPVDEVPVAPGDVIEWRYLAL